MTEQEEVLLKLGIDTSRMGPQLAAAKAKLKRELGDDNEWENIGTKAGKAFGKAFGAGAIARMGIWYAVLKLAQKAKEVFLDDSALGKWLGSYWNAKGDETAANERTVGNEKAEAELNKKVKERRQEEKKERDEIKDKWLERQNDQTKLAFALEKEQQIRIELIKFQGSALDKLKLQKELEEQINIIADKRKDLQTAFDQQKKEAAKKAEEEAKKEQERQKDLAQNSRDIAVESAKWRKMQDQEYDPNKPSLQELAGAGFHATQFNLGNGPGARTAQHILYLENLAKFNFSQGNDIWGKQNIDQRNKEYDWLASRGMVPHEEREYKEAILSSTRKFEELWAGRATLMVKPKTGP